MLLKRNFMGTANRHIPELYGADLRTIGQAISSNGRWGFASEGGILMSRAA